MIRKKVRGRSEQHLDFPGKRGAIAVTPRGSCLRAGLSAAMGTLARPRQEHRPPQGEFGAKLEPL